MRQEDERERELTPLEREVEEHLRMFRPAESGLDAIAIAYAAGCARRATTLFAWRLAAAVFAVGFGVMFAAVLLRQHDATPTGMPMVVHHPQPQQPPRSTPSATFIAMQPRDAASQWRLRDRVLEQGLDALVIPISSPAPAGQPIPRAGDTAWRSL